MPPLCRWLYESKGDLVSSDMIIILIFLEIKLRFDMPMAFANVFQESLEFENWDVCLLEKKKKTGTRGLLTSLFLFFK